MKITKVKIPCVCENCRKDLADFDVCLGNNTGKSLQFSLCKRCAWNLEDILDETTAIDFEAAEKE